MFSIFPCNFYFALGNINPINLSLRTYLMSGNLRIDPKATSQINDDFTFLNIGQPQRATDALEINLILTNQFNFLL